jgi:hypothetical protein
MPATQHQLQGNSPTITTSCKMSEHGAALGHSLLTMFATVQIKSAAMLTIKERELR